MKKKQIYILFNDSRSMEGESIQAANAALRLLLGAWGRDPSWREHLEVDIWLASGQRFAHLPDLKLHTLGPDISCTSESLSEDVMGQTLCRLLRIPSPDGAHYYRPQLVILSNAACCLADESLTKAFLHSPISDCLLLETGYRESLTLPFPHRSQSVETLNPHFACNYVTLDELKGPVTPSRVRSQVLVKQLQLVAEQGDADAQAQLADLYRRGLGVQRNTREARKWYLRAAKQKHVGAQFQLGELCWFGLNGQTDYAEAAKWYRRAAKQGCSESQHRLGIMSRYGQGIPQNDEKARTWWQLAAEQGHADAYLELGKLYLRGELNDPAAAEGYYTRAAELGNKAARIHLGLTGT